MISSSGTRVRGGKGAAAARHSKFGITLRGFDHRFWVSYRPFYCLQVITLITIVRPFNLFFKSKSDRRTFGVFCTILGAKNEEKKPRQRHFKKNKRCKSKRKPWKSQNRKNKTRPASGVRGALGGLWESYVPLNRRPKRHFGKIKLVKIEGKPDTNGFYSLLYFLRLL